jgi:poly(A) polymerase Pap1
MREWSNQVAIKCGIPEENLTKFEAQLFTFGSYYLGVCSRDGDIDVKF